MTLPVNVKIRKFRTARKMTQTALAAMIGVSQNTLSEYESGKYEPSTEIIAKLNKLGANIRPPFFVFVAKKLTALFVPVLQYSNPNSKPRLESFPSKHRSPEECWIRYQLIQRNIKLEAVAKKAGRTVATVSRVICKTRHSEKVETALAEMLGYPSYKYLIAAAIVNADRRAV